MSGVWYFAYGSNMCRAIFYERRGMRPLAARRAWLADHRICFDLPVGPGERGVANLVAAPGVYTHGVLYLLTADDCARLDWTEGVPRIYRRLPIEVVLDDGERIAAFTYQSPWSTTGRKPSARYLGLLVEGARQMSLPAEYVEFLAGHELAVDERETGGQPARSTRSTEP